MVSGTKDYGMFERSVILKFLKKVLDVENEDVNEKEICGVMN